MAADFDYQAGSEILRTIANPARLRILVHLLKGERSVAELEQVLKIRQPNLSQHLRELREAGLVSPRREAKSVFYKLAGEKHRMLGGILAQILGDERKLPDEKFGSSNGRTEAAQFAKLR